jgi:AICAR transformylase/IMP cyclohydrolase PurH
MEINKLFFAEVVIAPEYDAEQLKFYKEKTNYFNSKRSRLPKNKLDLV